MLDELSRFVSLQVPSGSAIVLGVSGGADSMAMLVAWSALARTRGERLIVAHFNHKLRAGADEDEDFVREAAERFGWPFESGAPVSPLARPGRSSESAARSARYQFLAGCARANAAAFVAVAHTADDQVETVLHSIFRGTGLDGVAGMRPQRSLAPGVTLLRPMLSIRRDAVRAFLAQRGESFRDDPTNADQSMTRNRLRGMLLPLLRAQFQPRVDEAVLRLSTIARETRDFVDAAAAELLDRAILERDDRTLRLLREPLARAGPFLAAEAVRLCLARRGWPRGRMGRREYRRIVAVARRGEPRRIDLPDGIHVRVVRGRPPSIELSRTSSATTDTSPAAESEPRQHP